MVRESSGCLPIGCRLNTPGTASQLQPSSASFTDLFSLHTVRSIQKTSFIKKKKRKKKKKMKKSNVLSVTFPRSRSSWAGGGKMLRRRLPRMMDKASIDGWLFWRSEVLLCQDLNLRGVFGDHYATEGSLRTSKFFADRSWASFIEHVNLDFFLLQAAFVGFYFNFREVLFPPPQLIKSLLIDVEEGNFLL